MSNALVCEWPDCETRVIRKIGSKAACLRHVNDLTTVGERREAMGLDPNKPPPGMVYTETLGVLLTEENRNAVLNAITVSDCDGGRVFINGKRSRQEEILAVRPGLRVGLVEGQRLIDPRAKARKP